MIRTEQDAKDYLARRASHAELEKLDALENYLREENERQNLVSQKSLEDMWVRHFLDSAQLLDHVSRETSGVWLDLGSGAGFPGLVIAILSQNHPTLLVESRTRRVEWLESMVQVLDLPNCDIAGKRLELVETREAAVISARAFAPLAKLLSLSARFSTGRTQWVLPKGLSAAQEVESLPQKFAGMFHVKPSLTHGEAGIVVGRGRVKV